jgi:hypothetical protein
MAERLKISVNQRQLADLLRVLPERISQATNRAGSFSGLMIRLITIWIPLSVSGWNTNAFSMPKANAGVCWNGSERP